MGHLEKENFLTFSSFEDVSQGLKKMQVELCWEHKGMCASAGFVLVPDEKF